MTPIQSTEKIMSNNIELVRCDISYDQEDQERGVVIKIIYRDGDSLVTMAPIHGDPDILTEIVSRELTEIGVLGDGRKDSKTRH